MSFFLNFFLILFFELRKTSLKLLCILYYLTMKYWKISIENSYRLQHLKSWYTMKKKPAPSENHLGLALWISLVLRLYLIVYPSSRHNTVTITERQNYKSRKFLLNGFVKQISMKRINNIKGFIVQKGVRFQENRAEKPINLRCVRKYISHLVHL